MATITALDSGTVIVNSTTITASGGLTVALNDWVVVLVACPNTGAGGAAPTITVDDSGGLNTYTQRAVVNRDPGSAGDGATFGIFTSQITNAVTSGDVTATLSDAAGSGAIQVYRMRPATGEVISFVSADSTGDTGNASSIANGSISVTNGDTIFAGASVETNGTATGDADTTNGSWSAIGNTVANKGSESASSACISQYKTVTATGSQAWTATYGGSHDFACSNVILRAAKTLIAAVGSYAIAGTAASPHLGRVVVAAAGSYAITGTAVTLSATGAKAVNAQPGQYDIIGTDASTLQAWKPTAGVGSYAITGTDASTLHGWAVIPDAPGSYVITGTDTPVLQTRKVVPDAGTYAITGTDVGLVKSGTFVIVAGPGSYAITGTDATTIHGYAIAAGAGSYALTGTNATLPRAFKIFFDVPGSYLITGTGVALTKTQAAVAPLIGTLRAAPYSFSLILGRPPSSVPVVSHIHSLQVDTIPPTLGVSSHIFTLKVR